MIKYNKIHELDPQGGWAWLNQTCRNVSRKWVSTVFKSCNL